MAATNPERLEAALGRFRSHRLVHRLRAFLADAPDEELFHIDLDRLAGLWDVERRVVLELFLRGIRFGLFNLDWAFQSRPCAGLHPERAGDVHLDEPESVVGQALRRSDAGHGNGEPPARFFLITRPVRALH